MQQALVGLQLVKMQQDLAVCSGYLKAFSGRLSMISSIMSEGI